MSTAQATRAVTLERRTDIDLESYRRVAREGAGIVIGEAAAERMRSARESFLALVESDPDAFIYGVTTSAGDGASTLLDPDQRRNLARMLGRSGASFGEPLPERVVRGIVLTRLTGMVEGNSGVRPELARAVAGMLESGPLPTVPSQGNGGSGEVLPLGHLFGTLSSRTVEDSREAMSLINGSPCASALVADATLSGRNRLALAERVCALTAEVIRTPDEQHSPLLETLWDEQHEVAALRSLRELLAGGAGERRHFQAPVSFRILPRVLGRLRRATAEAERAATSSLAAVSDNPVYVPPCEGYPLGATLSNGSYHNAQAPPAMDGLSDGLGRHLPAARAPDGAPADRSDGLRRRSRPGQDPLHGADLVGRGGARRRAADADPARRVRPERHLRALLLRLAAPGAGRALPRCRDGDRLGHRVPGAGRRQPRAAPGTRRAAR